VKYYELIVQVSDDGPGKLSDTASISVVISDVNENPVFPKAVRYVVENTPVDYIGNGAFLMEKESRMNGDHMMVFHLQVTLFAAEMEYQHVARVIYAKLSQLLQKNI
jgi:hypothetical protein